MFQPSKLETKLEIQVFSLTFASCQVLAALPLNLLKSVSSPSQLHHPTLCPYSLFLLQVSYVFSLASSLSTSDSFSARQPEVIRQKQESGIRLKDKPLNTALRTGPLLTCTEILREISISTCNLLVHRAWLCRSCRSWISALNCPLK